VAAGAGAEATVVAVGGIAAAAVAVTAVGGTVAAAVAMAAGVTMAAAAGLAVMVPDATPQPPETVLTVRSTNPHVLPAPLSNAQMAHGRSAKNLIPGAPATGTVAASPLICHDPKFTSARKGCTCFFVQLSLRWRLSRRPRLGWHRQRMQRTVARQGITLPLPAIVCRIQSEALHRVRARPPYV
jgi:hypothetical protein